MILNSNWCDLVWLCVQVCWRICVCVCFLHDHKTQYLLKRLARTSNRSVSSCGVAIKRPLLSSFAIS
uniref:Putative secreted peptide n=1 Tax=Anopheles braziliensis TaxID=58242 RepID=A0A2M3ZW77_9DIPT